MVDNGCMSEGEKIENCKLANRKTNVEGQFILTVHSVKSSVNYCEEKEQIIVKKNRFRLESELLVRLERQQ